MVEHSLRWAFSVEVGPIMPPDDGARAYHLGSSRDMPIRERLEWASDLAGWCAYCPFNLDNPEDVQSLRAAAKQIEQHAARVTHLLAGCSPPRTGRE